jgi:hypothetical protein
MPEEWRPKEIEWTIKDVGAPLLDSIARGLYSKLEVLREYVQNAADSYVDFQRMTGLAPQNTIQVWVDVDNLSLHIMDMGVGMDYSDLLTAKKIGVSPKLPRPNEFAGFRGLGIWSGLSACERLELTTTKVGAPYQYRLTINCKEIVEHLEDPIPIDELLEQRFDLSEADCAPDEHFTHVKLISIDRESYGDLLDITAMTRYAERSLPVPFDPAWEYAGEVQAILGGVLMSKHYDLTINGQQVYRQFPPTSEIRRPEKCIIDDEKGRQVAVAWVCETARTGTAKRLTPRPKDAWISNFAVRVKNIAVGPRGLYSDEDVSDSGNLDWYVGEIYVTDSDIRPDTKRTKFQPSARHDDVVRAIRKFYNGTALRARGLSAQQTAEADCDRAQELCAEIGRMLDEQAGSGNLFREATALDELRLKLEETRREANRPDQLDDAERTLIMRGYLRKVTDRIDAALGQIAMAQERISRTKSDVHEAVISQREGSNGSKGKRSKHRPAKLKGTAVPLPGILPTFAEPSSATEAERPKVELQTVLDAFGATVAAIVGEETEIYRRIMDRLPDELRRRGINV